MEVGKITLEEVKDSILELFEVGQAMESDETTAKAFELFGYFLKLKDFVTEINS